MRQAVVSRSAAATCLALGIAGFSLAASGCSAPSPEPPVGYALCARTGVFRTEAGLLHVCAPITPEVVQAVEAELGDSDRVLLITSDGGTPRDVLALAEVLRERDLTLKVEQFCLSACSTYVMALAPRVEVASYSVVAFHHTGAWVFDAIAARKAMPPDARYRQAPARERAAFRAAGFEDRLLDRIAMAVEPRCFREHQTSSGPVATLESAYAWYIPDRAALREIYGDRLSGPWTDDGEMAATILRGTLGQPRLRVAFGPLPDGEVRPEVIGPALPNCAPG